jgi:hypothetical protein
VLLLVSLDTGGINQFPDELEARLIADDFRPDGRKHLQHHPPLPSFIKFQDRGFNLLEFHGVIPLLLKGSRKKSVNIPWRLPSGKKGIAMADTMKIVENQSFLPWGPAIFRDFRARQASVNPLKGRARFNYRPRLTGLIFDY